MSALDTCRREIVRQHEVIQRWLAGTAPRTAEAFAAFSEALAPDFHIINPDGTLLGRDLTLNWVEGAHGGSPGLEIEIREVTVVAESGPLIVARYEEWHHGTAAAPPRLATVVFQRTPATPLWRHLHETWLPN